jgi:hypothetical protein
LSDAELGEHLILIARSADDGVAKTGRRFYYLVLSHGYIVPDMSATDAGKQSRDAAYGRVTRILGMLRKNRLLPWEAVLDLTREVVEWQVYSSPREARALLRKHYDEDRWLGQPYYPILVVEKDTLEPITQPIAFRWQMPFASSRGYSSLRLQHDVATMLRYRYAKNLRRRYEETKQAAVILFISDLDPSGLDLQRAWKDALDDFGVVVADFVRIGLTRDQVDALDNPRLQQGIEVKPSDSRARAYVERYGDRCWETDILPAATIEATIDAEINSWLDMAVWNRRDAEIETARRLI